MGPSGAFPTMTGFADGSRCSRSGAPGACAAGLPWSAAPRWSWWAAWRSSPTWSPSAPADVSNPMPPSTQQKPQSSKTVDWPLYGHDHGANPVPAGQATWTRRSAPRCGASRRASCSSSSRSWSRTGSTSWTRTGRSTRSAPTRARSSGSARSGSLNASSPAYCRRPAVRGQPRAAAGGGARAAQARKQGAVAPPAAGPQRVLAARPRRQGDLRLRVRRHLRPRREDRQDAAGRCTPAAP